MVRCGRFEHRGLRVATWRRCGVAGRGAVWEAQRSENGIPRNGCGSKNRNSKMACPGKRKHGPKPAVCPSDRLILSHTQMDFRESVSCFCGEGWAFGIQIELREWLGPENFIRQTFLKAFPVQRLGPGLVWSRFAWGHATPSWTLQMVPEEHGTQEAVYL